MTETTTEQLAEIEGQGQDSPATEYTPPEGWQEVPLGEPLKGGDEYHAGLDRYIRRIEPQPQPVQVREGRWRKRSGVEVSVSAMPTDHDDFTEAFPWWDGHETTWTQSGHLLSSGECPADLVEYLGPLEPEPQPEPQPHEEQIEELRSEVAYVQNLLGESRQRVTQLEELVSSLRTINDAQEKTVRLAGQENTDLKHRLNVVSAEWAEQAETVRKLQIELDAAQQVPQAIADRFEEGWNQGTARAVETIAEWLQPIRAVDHLNLSNETLQHLPQIMRHLTGLTQD